MQVKKEIKTEVKKEPSTYDFQPKKTDVKPTSKPDLNSIVKTLMSLNKTVVKKEILVKAETKLEVAKVINSNVANTQNSKIATPNSKITTPNSKITTPNSKIATPNSKYICTICQQGFKLIREFENHSMTAHTKDKKVNVQVKTNSKIATPNSKIATPNSKTATPNSKTETGKYICKICQQGFKLIREFEDHSMTAHTGNSEKENVQVKPNSGKVYVCNICQKDFKSINGFQNHMIKAHSRSVNSANSPKKENIQVEIKSEIKSEVKSEVKSEIKTEIKTEIKSEVLDDMDEIFKKADNLLLQRKIKVKSEPEEDDIFKKCDNIIQKSKNKKQTTSNKRDFSSIENSANPAEPLNKEDQPEPEVSSDNKENPKRQHFDPEVSFKNDKIKKENIESEEMPIFERDSTYLEQEIKKEIKVDPEVSFKKDSIVAKTPNSKIAKTPNSIIATPNSKFATPNSKIATPKSKIATPNSKIVSPPKLNLQPALTPFKSTIMEVSCKDLKGLLHTDR